MTFYFSPLTTVEFPGTWCLTQATQPGCTDYIAMLRITITRAHRTRACLDLFSYVRYRRLLSRSRASIAAVHPQICTGDIVRGIGQKEGNGSHEILGNAHLALRDERRPLCLQIRVIVENLLCPAGRGAMLLAFLLLTWDVDSDGLERGHGEGCFLTKL